MNVAMLLVGLAKALFGIVVGALGILVAARALHRFLGSGSLEGAERAGNIAIGILKAGSLLALGIMLQHAVISTFNAADLMYRNADVTLGAIRRVGVYALLHVGTAMVLSSLVLALGTWLFSRMTRDVNEMAEIRKGNAAPALVLAAVMVVLALMTAPGLQMALDGLLPLPELGRDQLEAPA
jgi:uncharacterized membrane protein YjfL (UPF0719 family)